VQHHEEGGQEVLGDIGRIGQQGTDDSGGEATDGMSGSGGKPFARSTKSPAKPSAGSRLRIDWESPTELAEPPNGLAGSRRPGRQRNGAKIAEAPRGHRPPLPRGRRAAASVPENRNPDGNSGRQSAPRFHRVGMSGMANRFNALTIRF
jgi:hypothetical protein